MTIMLILVYVFGQNNSPQMEVQLNISRVPCVGEYVRFLCCPNDARPIILMCEVTNVVHECNANSPNAATIVARLSE